MTAGADASTAGYPVLNPATDIVKNGATEINVTRDLVAKLTNDQAITIFVQSTTPTALHTNDLWFW